MSKFKWINFSEKRPECTGMYVIITHKQKQYLQIEDYSYERKGKRLLKSNDERKMIWAKWGYKEVCENVTEEHVIYKKEWAFFDTDRNEILDVIYYLALPSFPKEISNET